MDFRKLLAFFQVYAHIAFFIGLFYFPLLLTIPTIIVCQIIFVGMCGTALFHRTIAHKNAINPIVEKILVLLSWIGGSGSALAWAGTHRVHHRYSDTEKDPHSPMHHGIIRTYWLSSGDANITRYVPDLLRKPLYVFQHKHYFKVLILLHIVGLIFLPLSLYWAVLIVPAFLMWFAGSTVNVFCHDVNGPRNVSILGYLHAGEGWHGNHHDNPASSMFNNKHDWGGFLHKLMRLGNEVKA
jgi:fatty-acid desaturase